MPERIEQAQNSDKDNRNLRKKKIPKIERADSPEHTEQQTAPNDDMHKRRSSNLYFIVVD